MKKLLFVVLITSLLQTAFAQTSGTFHWERSQNGVAGSANYFVKTKNDNAGNVYALNNSDGDMLVVKFNNSAQVVQTYRYNNQGNENDLATDFEIDASGYVYITGYSFINGGYTMTLVKFDPSGNLLWELNYNPFNWIYPADVSSKAMCLDASGNAYLTGAMNDSIIAVKVNASGVVQWATKVNASTSYFGGGNDIAIDAFNSVFITGYYLGSSNNYDAFTAKLNSAGVVQWTRQIAGFANQDDRSLKIGVDNSSNVFTLSRIADTSYSNSTVYLTKYNASGAQQWQKKLFQSSQVNSTPVSLHVDNLGNNYIGIHTITASAGGYSIFYKHSASGSQLYSYVFDEPLEYDDQLTDMYVDANANLYATGLVQGTGKAFYLKLNPTGSAVFSGQSTHSGQNNFYTDLGIVAESTGFFNLVTSYQQVIEERYNNAGVFQYEGQYTGSANTFDNAIKVIGYGSSSVYALGTLSNSVSNADAVLSKYDGQGNILWQNIIDNNLASDFALGMAKDSAYNMYVLKSVNSTSEVIKFDSIGSPISTYPSNVNYKKIIVANGANIYLAGDGVNGSYEYEGFQVAKVSPAASLVYANPITSSPGYYITAQSMDIDLNQRLVVAGKRWFDYGQPTQKTALVVERFSPSGSLSWHRELVLPDSTTSDAANGCNIVKVIADAGNNIFVYGTAVTQANFGHSMSILAKYSSNGTLLWDTIYDNLGAWHETAGDMKLLSSGKLIIYAAGTGGQIIRKIDDADGSIIWQQAVYGGYSNDAGALAIDNNDDVFFAGSSISGSSVRDLYIGKVGSAGNLKWTLTKSGAIAGNDYAKSIDVTSSGRIYVAADMTNNSGFFYDFSVLKFCDVTTPVITTLDQTQNICPGQQVVLSTSVSNGYLWSDGVTANDSLIVTAAGNYFCTHIKNDGCSINTDTISVTVKAVPSTPEICAVTVDSLSTHNIIVWDKSGVTGANAFNIYREDVTNVYSYIGTVLYDSLSEFHDYGANPNVTTKRYKISASDTCGQESPLSNYHNTIYIVSNGSGQFSWNPVYTIENTANPVDNYLLMRDDNSNGTWTQIASTAGNQNTIVDPLYASFPNASYRVETAWSISCLPTRGAINTSRSNIRSPTSVIGIAEQLNENISMFPNPAEEQVIVKFYNRGSKKLIYVSDLLGRKIISLETESNEVTIDVSMLSPGSYIVEVISENSKSQKKLIKN